MQRKILSIITFLSLMMMTYNLTPNVDALANENPQIQRQSQSNTEIQFGLIKIIKTVQDEGKPTEKTVMRSELSWRGKDGTWRREVGNGSATLYNPNTRTETILNHSSKTAQQQVITPSPSPLTPTDPLPSRTIEDVDLGEKMLQGVKAHGRRIEIEISLPTSTVSQIIEVWKDHEGRRLQQSVFDPASGTREVIEFHYLMDIEMAEGEFQIPKGYKMVPPPTDQGR